MNPQELASKLGLDGLRTLVAATSPADALLDLTQDVEVDGQPVTVTFGQISQALMIARGWDRPAKRARRRR